MTHVVVVVPARDEQDAVVGTLRSVYGSLAAAHRDGLVTSSTLEVTAHRCRDATEERARALLRDRPGAHVTRDEESVTIGQVRDRTVRRGLARLGQPPGETWVLSTDADTTVERTWVGDVLRAAAATRVAGVVGLTRLDAWHGSPQAAVAYDRVLAAKMCAVPVDPLHQHDHVYAANLAVRADAYLAVGGFSHLTHGEDQALVDVLADRDYPLLRTRAVVVTTSGRLRGRAAGGLADHLARLEAVTTVLPSGAVGGAVGGASAGSRSPHGSHDQQPAPEQQAAQRSEQEHPDPEQSGQPGEPGQHVGVRRWRPAAAS